MVAVRRKAAKAITVAPNTAPSPNPRPRSSKMPAPTHALMPHGKPPPTNFVKNTPQPMPWKWAKKAAACRSANGAMSVPRIATASTPPDITSPSPNSMPMPSADSASAVGFTPYTRADGADGRCASSNSSRRSSALLFPFRATICGGNAPANGKPASNGKKCSVFEQNFPTFGEKWGSFILYQSDDTMLPHTRKPQAHIYAYSALGKKRSLLRF